MHLTDVAREVTSWMDDDVIKKLFLVGLLSSSDSFWKSNDYWHARVETLSGLRVPFRQEVNWAQTHRMLRRCFETDPEADEYWIKEDNATVCEILRKLGYSITPRILAYCCVHGSTKIFSYLTETASMNPSRVHYWCNEYHSVAMCVWHSQPEVLKLLLKDSRVSLTIRGLLYGTVLSDAVGSRRLSMDAYGGVCTINTSEPSRQVEVVRLLLEDGRVAPTEEEFYHCNIPGIMSLLLADTRLDPTASNNMPLQQAISRKATSVVRVLLADERVSKLVDRSTVELCRRCGTVAMMPLLLALLQE